MIIKTQNKNIISSRTHLTAYIFVRAYIYYKIHQLLQSAHKYDTRQLFILYTRNKNISINKK